MRSTPAPYSGTQQSADGIEYVGSSSYNQSGLTFDQSWSFRGEQ